jgi:hypothetical protein
MSLHPLAIFARDPRDEGVLRIHIYLLRLVFGLMFFALGWQTWSYVVTYQGPWNPREAIIWSVWTAFATLAGLGIFRPLKMLPILMLEIFYKVMWLILVAYPLITKGTLAGSKAEGVFSVFILVILPIIAVPWGYLFRTYVYAPRKPAIP